MLDRPYHLDANELRWPVRLPYWTALGFRNDRNLASRIGVTAQDLTAYSDGIVSPSSLSMIRMRRLSDWFVRAKSVRAAGTLSER